MTQESTEPMQRLVVVLVGLLVVAGVLVIGAVTVITFALTGVGRDDLRSTERTEQPTPATAPPPVAEDSAPVEHTPPAAPTTLPEPSISVLPDSAIFDTAVDRPSEGMFTTVDDLVQSIVRHEGRFLGLRSSDGTSIPLVQSDDGISWSPISAVLDAELDLPAGDDAIRRFETLVVNPDGSLGLYMAEARRGEGDQAQSYLNDVNRWLRSTDSEYWELDERFAPLPGNAARWWVEPAPEGFFAGAYPEDPLVQDGVDASRLTDQCNNAAYPLYHEYHVALDPDFATIVPFERLSPFVVLDDGRVAWLEAGSLPQGVEENCRDLLDLPESGPITLQVLDPTSGVQAALALGSDQVTIEPLHRSTPTFLSGEGPLLRVLFDNAVWEVDVDGVGWEPLFSLPDFRDFGARMLIDDGERVVVFTEDAMYVGDLWTGGWERYAAERQFDTGGMYPRYIDEDTLLVSEGFSYLHVDLPPREIDDES